MLGGVKMKYEVTFAMCHCETAIVELEPEDIEGLSEDEIYALVEEEGRELVTRESGFDVDEMVELCEID
jgi:hypothetical protein